MFKYDRPRRLFNIAAVKKNFKMLENINNKLVFNRF